MNLFPSRKPRPRLPVTEYIGAKFYFVTICTHKRESYFFINNDFNEYEIILSKTAGVYDFHVLIYCFMPDHIHLVLQGNEKSDLIQFVSKFKQLCAYRFKEQNLKKLWQDSFYDKVLWVEEKVIEAVRYTLNNPVRRGLVTNALEYPYSGSFCFPLNAIIRA